MTKKYSATMFCCLFILFQAMTQDIYLRNKSADVLSYEFNLKLSDDSDEIVGEALITVHFENNQEKFMLDLIARNGHYGMEVTGVYDNGVEADYTYNNDKIIIDLSQSGSLERTLRVQYRGVAEKGLVIDTTKFGQRSFFGDNWPNLARHWLPSVDHPYDKASIEFNITAPAHYDVVATGKKIEESYLDSELKLTTYRESAPVAMKVVTIGVTKFASRLLGMVGDIPVTAWVYPENRLEGFSDFQVAVDVMEFYVKNIGPYPYSKLANMQAKTQWGGLENAGTIAYAENSVTGNNTAEGLIAHEIAHQWFGNSASENDWNHVWLSEGFATYLTILFQEYVYGNEKRKEELEMDRAQIIKYYKRNPAPIVDNSISDPRHVLSVNTYQKGGWVLNMLRHLVGDGVFWEGMRNYYQSFKNANAMTEDFRKIMEDVSGMDLEEFFEQWIYLPGFPELNWTWKYENNHLLITVDQAQTHHIYRFPLEIGIVNGNDVDIRTVNIDSQSNSFDFPMDVQPDYLLFDPEVWLLFEEK